MNIVVIIPYFGKWPLNYFNLFAESLKRNPNLHYLFITDNEMPENTNNQFIKRFTTFEELKILFEDKLGRSINLTTPRKLCDLKPFYGLVFSEEIKEYDFWAFGDLDIMFGNTESILQPLLENFDILTFHPYWISGPFTLFRNKKQINELFLKSVHLESILSNPDYVGFDECGKKYIALEKGLDVLEYRNHDELKNDIECLTYLINKESKEGQVRFYKQNWIKESVLLTETIHYENGNLSFNGNKLLFYHFITEKQYYRFKFPKWKTLPDSFIINHTGMFLTDSPPLLISLIFKYRVLSNEIYRFCGKLYLSINYRFLKRTPKLKYRINVFR